MAKFTVNSFKKSKREGKKISMLTAYDYTTASLLDEAGVDTILVGDSLGMTMLGYDNTLEVTVDDIIHHTKAVERGAKNAFIVADMPFMSYHVSVEDSIRNAGRMIKEGRAHAIKLEGGREVIDKIEGIVAAKIPVVGHLGLTPQSVNMLGGFKVQGKNVDKAREIIEDAKLLEEKGVCAIVLECIPEALAKIISESISIPTIGIGAGKYCDGQVLVIQDMLGLYKGFQAKFVKRYKNLGDEVIDATREYIKEINSEQFPLKEHTFGMDEEILKNL